MTHSRYRRDLQPRLQVFSFLCPLHVFFADLTPGRYVAIATAKDGTVYEGTTAASNVFKLFLSYEVEVETGQYATSARTNYALNGVNFVRVKYEPLTVLANKCWLQIDDESADVKAISLVEEDDATGMNEANGANGANGAEPNGASEANGWYDLNGRKVQKPTKKGIYIHGGKKVIK